MAANHFLSALGNANAEMLDFHAPLSATVVAHVTVNALCSVISLVVFIVSLI